MTRISTGPNLFLKKVFPILWFGFLIFFVAQSWFAGAYDAQPATLLVPLAIGLVGLVFMKMIVWRLADEVYDCGDALLIKRGDEEERVALSDIVKVEYSIVSNPPRVTLYLGGTSRFGHRIGFTPDAPFSINPFTRFRFKHLMVEELRGRIERARTRARSPGAV